MVQPGRNGDRLHSERLRGEEHTSNERCSARGAQRLSSADEQQGIARVSEQADDVEDETALSAKARSNPAVGEVERAIVAEFTCAREQVQHRVRARQAHGPGVVEGKGQI